MEHTGKRDERLQHLQKKFDKTLSERTGTYHEQVSKEHHKFGPDIFCTDLDWVPDKNHPYNFEEEEGWIAWEYCRDTSDPVAVIDWKHHNALNADGSIPFKLLNHGGIKMQAKLADNYGPGALPAFIIFYWPDDGWGLWLVPVNKKAKEFTLGRSLIIQQRQLCSYLYHIRGIEPSKSLLESLGDEYPPIELPGQKIPAIFKTSAA